MGLVLKLWLTKLEQSVLTLVLEVFMRSLILTIKIQMVIQILITLLLKLQEKLMGHTLDYHFCSKNKKAVSIL